MMMTISEWGANIYFSHAPNGHASLFNSVSGKAEAGESLFCITVNTGELNFLEQS